MTMPVVQAVPSPQRGDRVGLFGGSFDPVHKAHLQLAASALQTLQLQQLRWVPTGQAWQKARTLSDAAHRVAMLQAAIAGQPRFVLDCIELDRQGPSYTLDTVRALDAASPGVDWYLIIGQDQYDNLHTWRDWRQLLGLVTLAVANRPTVIEVAKVAKHDSAAEVALGPHPDVLAWVHRMVPLPMLDISSTDIRQRVGSGQDISTLVPPAVARYIESQQLYRNAARAAPFSSS